MSLQDAHLKQALQSAPDRDLAPSDDVRQKILGYAQQAVPAQESWFKRYINRFNAWQLSRWQLVGMSTIASVFLVMVMVRPQLPDMPSVSDAPVWKDASEQEIAQVDQAKAKKEEYAPKITLTLPNDSELFSPAVNDDLDIQFEESTDSAPTASFRKSAKKKAAIQEESDSKKVEKMADAVAIAQEEDAIVAAPTQAAAANTQAEADIAEEAMIVDETVAAAKSGQNVSKSAAVVGRSLSPANKTISGVALAKQDIQAGNFRLLLTVDALAADKPLVDAETGFRIESVANTQLLDNEVEAYNQTMRDWYRAK